MVGGAAGEQFLKQRCFRFSITCCVYLYTYLIKKDLELVIISYRAQISFYYLEVRIGKNFGGDRHLQKGFFFRNQRKNKTYGIVFQHRDFLFH